MTQQDGQYLLGIDVGGTHTDLALSRPGEVRRSKALTTHGNYSQGVMDAIEIAATDLGLTARELLERSDGLVNGTTIVTNAVTEMRGAKVGILVTSGFADVFRTLGGARRTAYDDHLQTNPPDIVDRADIHEVAERVDSDGMELVALDEDAVRAAVAKLRESGVEGIAVCFLWSFKHPAHERRAREIIHEEWPDVFVTLSAEIHPVIREHERFMTAVLNCYCQPACAALLDTLEDRLVADGFRGQLTFFSGAGGAISKSTATRFPVLLLHSGPAGGVIGALRIAERLHLGDIIVGDMGGTSFDTALVQHGQPMVTPRVKIDTYDTGVSVVEVLSVGAGGGSIGWLDERGVPQTGPHSAGSMPGPACYSRGGTQPTVTDAALLLGMIDPKRYLGGRMELDPAAARDAMASVFTEADGWTVDGAAEAIVELTATNMAHALRRVSVERGHDPRDFLFVAYGGTSPFFVTRICEKIGMTKALVPPNSPVFSAFGLLTADYVRRHGRTVEWDLGSGGTVDHVNAIRDEVRAMAIEETKLDGLDPNQCDFAWSGEFRFKGQAFELPMNLHDAPFTPGDAKDLTDDFKEAFERAYGEGSSWKDAPVELLTLNLTLTSERPRPTLQMAEVGGEDPTDALRGNRLVHDPHLGFTLNNVYADELVTPGMRITGPAIVEAVDTTLVVSSGWTCTRDGLGGYNLERKNVNE